jgi:curli biogenesis system outer membrane secretion channel CsgG
VGDFTVAIRGAPQEIGDGLREMLLTALFESNYFIVVDRMDTLGIDAERLLSESFMANPEAILMQEKMIPAEVMVYGAITQFEGGGSGIRMKVPGAAVKFGAAYHEAKVTIDLRVVDAASGEIVANEVVQGNALSGKAMVGTTMKATALPFCLNFARNTSVELAIRDCICRAVITMCKTIPRSFFRHGGL